MTNRNISFIVKDQDPVDAAAHRYGADRVPGHVRGNAAWARSW